MSLKNKYQIFLHVFLHQKYCILKQSDKIYRYNLTKPAMSFVKDDSWIDNGLHLTCQMDVNLEHE